MNKTFTIKVTMKDRWIPDFLGMLKHMEYLGNVGSSRKISIFADGDGDFHPKFEWDTEIEPVEARSRDKDNNVLFDAG